MQRLCSQKTRSVGSTIVYVMFVLSLLSDVFEASTSLHDATSGYHRLRQKAHRRRHKEKVDDEGIVEMKGSTQEILYPRAIVREKNEDLCESERTSVELNTEEYEFEPPFIVEIRCKNVYDYEKGDNTHLLEQTCVHGVLRCVQRYSEVQTVRRRIHSSLWHPHLIRAVPSGCDCMWPVDKYGHQDL